MRYRTSLPHNRPILDALVAAVPLTILGLTLSFFIQAPVVSFLTCGRTPSFWLRCFFVLRSHLRAHLHQWITAETVLGYRHLPGLPLTFLDPREIMLSISRGWTLGSLVLVGAALILALISAYMVMLGSTVPPPGRLPVRTSPIPILIESAGHLQKVYVTNGSPVRIGDPIIQLDTRHLLARKHELESLIHAAELNSDEPSSNIADLYRELQQVQLDLDRLTITSPVDGKIHSLASVYPGKVLPAGTAIAVVVKSEVGE